MDVLTDTEMPDRSVDAHQKTSRCMRCTDAPNPQDIWGTYGIGGTYRCMGVWGYIDAPYVVC